MEPWPPGPTLLLPNGWKYDDDGLDTLAAFQRNLSLPSSACPRSQSAPLHTTHTGQSRRRRRGRASRWPLVRGRGPPSSELLACSRPALPQDGADPAPSAAGTRAARRRRGLPERSADKARPLSWRWNRGLSPQQGAGGSKPGPLPPCFADGLYLDDPCEKRARERRRHEGRGRREAATARRTAGDMQA